MTDPVSEQKDGTPYRVLARKYRPATFEDLIGQEALVRTLTNALESGRLAQAFILTGVRGVGKTTTARIIARALNCVGPDGEGGPTVQPCGVCPQCTAIAQDRHVDVVEMDAASHTGVAEMRDLIESARYLPVEARRKVYIIDEVHMLSTSAFNALLKTLEEPPAHVVFIFATTEIRKVPITVLSRCQRFDLRRLDQARLETHFADVCEREAVATEPEALRMIARAADGSVRDGLSILDQAIALGGGGVKAADVNDMLGLADRTRIFDLLESLLRGEATDALRQLEDLYQVGADPAVIIQDLLELTHLVTRARLVPSSLEEQPEADQTRGAALAEAVKVPELTRCWQLLLKGLEEVHAAPHRRQAAEMVLIRVLHASRLPTPAELVREIKAHSAGAAKASPPNPPASASGDDRDANVPAGNSPPPVKGPSGETASAALRQPQTLEPEAVAEPKVSSKKDEPKDLEAIVRFAEKSKSMMLANHLKRDVHLVHFEPGRLEFRPGEGAPPSLAQDLGKLLLDWTGERWMVSVSQAAGDETIQERRDRREAERRAQIMSHPFVQAALETFPDARVGAVRDKTAASTALDEETATPRTESEEGE